MKLKTPGACLRCWSKVLDFFLKGNVTVYFDCVQLLFYLYKTKLTRFYHIFAVIGVHVVIYSEFPRAFTGFNIFSSEQSLRLSSESSRVYYKKNL